MPEERSVEDTPASQRLTNEDFRKLLMTPRATPASSNAGPHPVGSVREAMANAGSMAPPGESKSELRRKKKSLYAALKKQEDSKLAELAEKYRDRARERRDGVSDLPQDPSASTASAYRAVAPDLKSGMDAKERRRQLIQESKYLGGDMEHTHLVKGLDYALLQKVRSEIVTREQEQEAEMERLATVPDAPAQPPQPAPHHKDKPLDSAEEEIEFQTQLGRDIYKMIAQQRNKKVVRNELFSAGRMAYVVEVEEEQALDTDIPTTLLRSRHDLDAQGLGQGQGHGQGQGDRGSSHAGDLVLAKLGQIFAYLRASANPQHKPSRAKKAKDKVGGKGKGGDDSIYGDIGEYVPGRRRDAERDRDRTGTATGAGDAPRGSYFGAGAQPERDAAAAGHAGVGGGPEAGIEGVRAAGVRAGVLLERLAGEVEGYAECYPGLREMDDAIDDSDDEVDYTKMDSGNKKGPIGRWDFDTQEEYSAYMSSKEALPKAAFQYGVKTSDGRKTRKTNRDKNDKAELDREWQQIQNIIQKRKAPKDTDEPNFKSSRY